MRLKQTGFATLAIVLFGITPGSAQDAARGEELFGVCAGCHAVGEGENGVGPTLAGLIGRDIGSVDGFAYSDALNGIGGVWDEETLDEFLADVQAFAPGSSMDFPAVSDAQDRADIIAYLAGL